MEEGKGNGKEGGVIVPPLPFFLPFRFSMISTGNRDCGRPTRFVCMCVCVQSLCQCGCECKILLMSDPPLGIYDIDKKRPRPDLLGVASPGGGEMLVNQFCVQFCRRRREERTRGGGQGSKSQFYQSV